MERDKSASRPVLSFLHAVESCVFSVIRKAFYVCGRDITSLASGKRCLVIAPHPDDEVLGCGSAIMRTRQASQLVRIVFVTDGRHSHRSVTMTPDDIAASREIEALRACRKLGVDAQDVVFLRYADGSTAQHMDKIIADLRSQIADFSPGCLFSPFGIDSHSDHRSIAIAIDRLARAGIITCPVYEYPVWFWSFGAWRDALLSLFRKSNTRPFGIRSLLRPRTITSADCRDRKWLALAEHRSQVTNLTGEPGWQTLSPWFLHHFFGTQELFFEKPVPDKT
jgi:LmbE family N-acetylglucosaminyl deacetylase